MPPTRPTPGSARDWLARAKGDMALARAPLPEGAFYEDLCFHAQQAAEKAIKAVYRHRDWAFRYTHDLEELLAGLKSRGLEIPQKVDDAIVLTSYAWETRYPGFTEPIALGEYQEVLLQAQAVLDWAEKEIGP